MQPNLEVEGPGAIANPGVAPIASLEGATDAEFVVLLNPMPVDFMGLVGVSTPQDVPFKVRTDGVNPVSSTTEGEVIKNYGLNLKNRDHTNYAHIATRHLIKSGQTLTMPGAQAQVIVKQLVNAILSRQGKKLLLADPFMRSEIEQQIIVRRGFMSELYNEPIPSVQQQHLDKINEMNRTPDEEEFPGVTQQPDRSSGSGKGESDSIESSAQKQSATAKKAA